MVTTNEQARRELHEFLCKWSGRAIYELEVTTGPFGLKIAAKYPSTITDI